MYKKYIDDSFVNAQLVHRYFRFVATPLAFIGTKNIPFPLKSYNLIIRREICIHKLKNTALILMYPYFGEMSNNKPRFLSNFVSPLLERGSNIKIIACSRG